MGFAFKVKGDVLPVTAIVGVARLDADSTPWDILLLFELSATPPIRTVRVVLLSKVMVTVAPMTSRPETLAAWSGPGAAAPFTLVGSISAEKVMVFPGPNDTPAPKSTRRTS